MTPQSFYSSAGWLPPGWNDSPGSQWTPRGHWLPLHYCSISIASIYTFTSFNNTKTIWKQHTINNHTWSGTNGYNGHTQLCSEDSSLVVSAFSSQIYFFALGISLRILAGLPLSSQETLLANFTFEQLATAKLHLQTGSHRRTSSSNR